METLVDERRGSDDQGDDNGYGEDNDDEPVFSLVTGTYRHPKRYGGGGEDQQQGGTSSGVQSAVILRNQDSAITQLDIAAGRFSFTRAFVPLHRSQ